MARLLILYLLLEGERSAYDVKQILSSPFVSYWFTLADPSIYSALKTLAKNGFANSRKSGRATTYRITKKGVVEFKTCLERAWKSNDEKEFLAALAVSPDLTARDLRQHLEDRVGLAQTRYEQLQAIKSGAMSSLLASREEFLLNAEREWLREALNGA